ncbi:hypothetical protein ACRE_042780 [Hapsidospora chrysogenum ATCC 11550]|uniref:Uncharacterized protein n=1 Tax=Hapsidospora chrysogenum (strain ATCC 11550 / CBS 779.69 / DSM 880 / IAM 14645 / JCM 23072 / IMI 49137) TaxID=857340 RepID=A0A086T6H9_HAPC1|nr:hypothetical protein ACRE_042780 [Hapsidospora chrysogenum ATCC 11550]
MDHHHRSSLAASETTYHSFNDVELFEPASPPSPKKKSSSKGLDHGTEMTRYYPSRPGSGHEEEEDDGRQPPTAFQMKRQDSGYESYTPTPRTSISRARRPSPPPRRRTSLSTTTSAAAVPSARPRTRPSTRRSTKSYHHPNSSSVHIVRALHTPPDMQAPSSYFHFPSPDQETLVHHGTLDEQHHHEQESEAPPAELLAQLPPQTTHYWTSDRTRRLEYAAIDAASRGVKGWVRRNLLPDCLAARDGPAARHIPFDDDSGSVRRYRLELEEDAQSQHPEEKSSAAAGGSRRRMWSFWTRSGAR